VKIEVNGDFSEDGKKNVVEIGFIFDEPGCSGSFWTVISEAQANRLIERIGAELAESHEIRNEQTESKKKKRR
jgi:hypothetical protein